MPSTKVTNPYEFYISKNTSVSAEISIIMLNVTINQLAHELITVTAGGKNYTSSFTIPYGTTYTATIKADEGYTAGTVTPTSGTFTTDSTFTATAATINSYTVTITPGAHQTITVTNVTTGKSYTSTFTANYGDKLTATITADPGYTASTLNHTSATVGISGATFEATGDATINSYTVTITQSANQTITVNDGTRNHTSSFSAPYGTKLTASIVANTGYTAGTLNQTSATVGASGATFSATAATVNSYSVVITQTANQTIKVNDGNTDHTETFSIPYGTELTCSITPATGYTASRLSVTGATLDSSNKFRMPAKNVTVTATANATINSYTVTINQTTGQTITVNDGTTNHTSSFTAPYGTKLTATLTPAEGYTAGKLNQTAATVGTSGATFSATAATIQTRTITVEQPANGRIEVNGQVGTSFTFNYGTKVKIELKANTGYTPSALYIATED